MTTDPYRRLLALSKWKNGCLVFQGGTSGNGYGRFWYNGKMEMAHRVSWSLSGRILESGLTIDHICRNRRCINPGHLRQITGRENILSGTGPPALNLRKTHCHNGHEFTPNNTYRFGKNRNYRSCRICLCANYKRYRIKDLGK